MWNAYPYVGRYPTVSPACTVRGKGGLAAMRYDKIDKKSHYWFCYQARVHSHRIRSRHDRVPHE